MPESGAIVRARHPDLDEKRQHMTAQHPWPPRVLVPGDLPAIDRGNGARTTPLVTREVGATAFLNGVTAFAPGAKIAHHRHNCAESVMIVDGTAVVDIDGVRTTLARLDTTFVPANVPHHFETASHTEPMTIFWTDASVDATRRLDPTGEARRVDAEAGSGPGDACRETARIRVRPGAEKAFEAAVAEAVPLFQRTPGCRSLELRRIVEEPSTYVLCVVWDSLAAHVDGFRASAEYARWRALASPFFAQPPVVVHDRPVLQGF
jgi:heme-degrading monooxygenase HmoA/quercetin dioxygenase-like cupin family protein